MMKGKGVLFTGGNGLLGKEVRNLLPEALYPGRSEFDIRDYCQMSAYLKGREITKIVHAAAFTSPPKINENPGLALESNVIGTANIVKLCMENNLKLYYISTDYVFKGDKGNYKEEDPFIPQNKYAWSKLGGECAAQLYDNSLIIRTSFSENEFPYEKAFVDQWTTRLPVSEFARKLVELLQKEEGETGTVHMGGPRRTVFEYAKSISPDKEIGELSLKNVSFTAPADTSLDTTKYKSMINK